MNDEIKSEHERGLAVPLVESWRMAYVIVVVVFVLDVAAFYGLGRYFA